MDLTNFKTPDWRFETASKACLFIAFSATCSSAQIGDWALSSPTKTANVKPAVAPRQAERNVVAVSHAATYARITERPATYVLPSVFQRTRQDTVTD